MLVSWFRAASAVGIKLSETLYTDGDELSLTFISVQFEVMKYVICSIDIC